MKLVIILPTYNERDNIIRLLDSLRISLADARGYDISYLVADDNSPDGTKDLVLQYQKKHPDVLVISGEKQGLGKALLRGMTYAVNEMSTDYIVQMDADLSHDPKVVPKFLQALTKGADFVIGCRYIKGGSIPENWGLHRKVFSIVANAIVRIGLGRPKIHDWTGGFRAFNKRYYEKLNHEMEKFSGYVFQIAFLHKSLLLGAKVVEVPIHFTDRRFGRSKIVPSEYIRKVLLYVASARLQELFARSFVKFMTVGTIGFVINTIVLEIGVLLGFHPLAGSIAGAELAIVSNFLLNNAWTFSDRKIDHENKLKKFFQFNMTSVGAILFQAGSVYAGTWAYGVDSYRVFYLFGVFIGLVWNYIMYSRVIWKK